MDKTTAFSFPFQPLAEHLRLSVTAPSGAQCDIFDTCIADQAAQREIGYRVATLLSQSEEKKLLKQMQPPLE